ncbi:hypothetical protein [Sphingobacterium sp. NPDC055346]
MGQDLGLNQDGKEERMGQDYSDGMVASRRLSSQAEVLVDEHAFIPNFSHLISHISYL